MTLDYLKLQEIAELKEALKIKAINVTLLEHLQSSVLYILDYSDKHEVPLPDLERIQDCIAHANRLIELLQNNGRELPTSPNRNENQPDSEHYQNLGRLLLTYLPKMSVSMLTVSPFRLRPSVVSPNV